MAWGHEDVRMADEPKLTVQVAEEIRALLARRDMSRSELARRLGVSAMWVSDRLRGQTPIGLDDLERMARILGVEPVDLLPRSANLSSRSNLDKTQAPVRPRDNRPKGRSENGLANRRTRQKRALTPEELSVITA